MDSTPNFTGQKIQDLLVKPSSRIQDWLDDGEEGVITRLHITGYNNLGYIARVDLDKRDPWLYVYVEEGSERIKFCFTANDDVAIINNMIISVKDGIIIAYDTDGNIIRRSRSF